MLLSNKIVESETRKLGFDLTGFAPAEKLEKEVNFLHQWLANNYHAGMEYMSRNTEKREDVTQILPEAKSVISLAYNYYTPIEHDNKPGKISRYAWGADYHTILWEKLALLEQALKNIDPGFKCKSYVDTGPVMDKVWAVRSGLGWMGKHTNIINSKKGSWFFLATIITNRSFEYAEPAADFCGSCTACIDACPTDALTPYQLDSNKCISYLTIENKNEIPDKFGGKFDGWGFGCDICQDVCPWNNKFAAATEDTRFYPVEGTTIEHGEIERMTGGEFNRKYKNSPIQRARKKGILRNLEFLKRQP